MKVTIQGTVMGTASVQRAQGDVGYRVEIYQPGEREIIQILFPQDPCWAEGVKVSGEARVRAMAGKDERPFMATTPLDGWRVEVGVLKKEK